MFVIPVICMAPLWFDCIVGNELCTGSEEGCDVFDGIPRSRDVCNGVGRKCGEEATAAFCAFMPEIFNLWQKCQFIKKAYYFCARDLVACPRHLWIFSLHQNQQNLWQKYRNRPRKWWNVVNLDKIGLRSFCTCQKIKKKISGQI